MNRLKALFCFLVLLIGGGFMIFGGVKQYQSTTRIKKEGQQALGKVVDREERRGRKNRRSYYLTVAYQTAARESFEERQRVSREVYEQSSSGTVTVHYLPSKPEVCAFGDEVKTKFGTAVWGLIALVGSFFLLKGVVDSGDESDGGASDTAAPTTQVAQTSQNNAASAPSPAGSSSDDELEEAA